MADVDRYKDPEKRRKYQKEWKKKNSDKVNRYFRGYHRRKRKKALLIVGKGKLECKRCGSTRYDWLEINHIDGEGNKDRKISGGSYGIIQAIVTGKRNIEEFNILCRPCNLIDAAEKMSGREYKIVL